MNVTGARRAPATIRVRLLLALMIALAPLLVFGVAQTTIVYSKDVQTRSASLVSAARLHAETAAVRVTAGAMLLETLTSQSVGLQCSQSLNTIVEDLQGYENLIRFDSLGRISCISGQAVGNGDWRNSQWFQQVAAGDSLVLVEAPPTLAQEPSLLAVVRSEEDGRFDGAMAAVITLDSLRASLVDPSIAGSEVALVDSEGNYLTRTDPGAFPPSMTSLKSRMQGRDVVFKARDAGDRQRLYAASALVNDDFFVVMSAPSQSLSEWSRVNLLSTIAPPLLAFLLAVGAVWVVADRVVIRWLHYLQRIASIYAKGRFTVRAVRAVTAPPEIAELAATLDAMADTIVERDEKLLESIAEKDRLMREIHHRVKNNLQVISSMVSMQQRALPDPAMREVLYDIRQRISALALIYRTLYQGPDLRRVDLKVFLEELTAQLIMSETTRGHAVDTELTADHLEVDPDRLAPVALFAVEAITNAQKHVFHDRGGALRITFSADEVDARLEIADSGGADAAGAIEKLRKGVGGVLMTAFARQLGGKADFNVNPQGGLTAGVTFPVADPLARHGNSQAA